MASERVCDQFHIDNVTYTEYLTDIKVIYFAWQENQGGIQFNSAREIIIPMHASAEEVKQFIIDQISKTEDQDEVARLRAMYGCFVQPDEPGESDSEVIDISERLNL